MNYQFYVVGKKDSDCYVIHDARDGMGGKACASKYTLAQLINNGYSICGINSKSLKNGKSLSVHDVIIVTLQGNPATSINTYPNVVDTKRSLSTFVKGIKRTKEEIAKAKLIGEKRSESIQNKKSKEDNSSSELIAFYKEYINLDGKSERFTTSKATRIYNFKLPNQERVEDFEQLYNKDGKPMAVYYSQMRDVCVSKEALLKKYKDIISSFDLKDGKYISHNLMPKYGSTPMEIVKYVISNTKKPIKYTYGLKYRKPTTMNVPISAESALKYISRGMCDITEYEDYIDVNEFSENDMW